MSADDSQTTSADCADSGEQQTHLREPGTRAPRRGRWRTVGRWAFRGAAAAAALLVAAVTVVLVVLWSGQRGRLTLPAPTGPFPVGRTTYDWVDPARADPFAPTPGTPRELPVWVWYPAAPTASAHRADYMPPLWRRALARHQGWLMTTFLTHDAGRVRAHSWAGPALAAARPSYPVVLMRSGIGAQATAYTTLAEDLASHGYIVVGMDAPYSTTVVVRPDGQVVGKTGDGNIGETASAAELQTGHANKILKVWSTDTRFILDRLTELDRADPSGLFTHRLDLTKVGVFGHSFGGATAAQFCHDDNRCKAGIDVDGMLYGSVVDQGLHRPFLFLTSDHGDPSDPVNRAALAGIRSVYASLPADQRFWIGVHGAGHFNFSDEALLKDNTITQLTGLTGPIGPRRGLAITTALIRGFLDTYLTQQPGGFPGDLLHRYPQAQPQR